MRSKNVPKSPHSTLFPRPALPLLSQSRPVFEFFVVSGSDTYVPPMMAGTTDLEDSLNIQIWDELGKGPAPGAIAEGLLVPPSLLQSHIDAPIKAELLRPVAMPTSLSVHSDVRVPGHPLRFRPETWFTSPLRREWLGLRVCGGLCRSSDT
jgi:hypothetical protein